MLRIHGRSFLRYLAVCSPSSVLYQFVLWTTWWQIRTHGKRRRSLALAGRTEGKKPVLKLPRAGPLIGRDRFSLDDAPLSAGPFCPFRWEHLADRLCGEISRFLF